MSIQPKALLILAWLITATSGPACLVCSVCEVSGCFSISMCLQALAAAPEASSLLPGQLPLTFAPPLYLSAAGVVSLNAAQLPAGGGGALGSTQAAALQVTGSSILSTAQASSLQVTGSTILGSVTASSVSVDSTAQFDASVYIDGPLTAYGDVVVGDGRNETLTVYAVTTFESTASPITSNAAIIANADVTANAALTANGAFMARSAATIAGLLAAQGNTVIGSPGTPSSSTLTVYAVTTFAASAAPITANAQLVANAGLSVAGALVASGEQSAPGGCF